MIREIGDRLTLVGVAHILPKSMEEVEEAIHAKEPETVAVELCPSRYMELVGGNGRSEAKMEFSRAGILARILKFIQDRMARKTGMLPGEEMLTAIRKAEETGADVMLIDQNIDMTIQKLVNEMGLRDKISILFEIAKSMVLGGEEVNLNDLTDEETVRNVVDSFRELSEPAYRVLVEQRNEHMVSRMETIMRSTTGDVVCVVGAGHVPGMIDELETMYEEQKLEPWDNLEMEWEIR